MKLENGSINLNWEDFEKFGAELAEDIKKDDISFNGIVSIARGGLVLGRMLSDKLELPLHTIHTNRYKIGNNHTTESIASGIITGNQELSGNILVVDDLTQSGVTLEKVVRKLKRIDNVKLIKSATIYNKNNSKFKPNYYVKSTEKLIVFPYEVTEYQKKK